MMQMMDDRFPRFVQKLAIVIVEHRIELLDTIADRAMVMDAGEVISEGSLAEILADPKVHAAYFENVEESALE